MKAQSSIADQAILLDGYKGCIESIGQIILRVVPVAILLISAKLTAHWPLVIFGVRITEKWAYIAWGFVAFGACMAVFVQMQKGKEYLRKLTRATRKQAAIYASFCNFLADFGATPRERILSRLPIGFLIVAFWICLATLVLLNPHEWSRSFELMLLGAGILCLQSVSTSEALMHQHRRNPYEWRLKLPILGRVTVDDVVFYCAVGTGAVVAFVLLEIMPRLALKHNLK